MLLFLKRSVLAVTLTLLLYMASYTYYGRAKTRPSPSFSTAGPVVPERARRHLILSWTGFFKFPRFLSPDLERLGCPSCRVTTDRNLLNISQAVVFHLFDVNVTDLPVLKKHGQRWVMVSFESPVHRPTGRGAAVHLGGRIDWTVTYRRDSDIPSFYGRVERRLQPRTDVEKASADEETRRIFSRLRPVAWMVSHCRTHGQRESLVRELRRKVRVDLFGKCGGQRGMLLWSRDRAYKHLSQKYKFYLSFENAVCKDYVTEKVYYPLKHGLVPVVYGGADYKALLPPKSYVDVLDFGTLEQLAEHLSAVSANYSRYSEYLEWRKDYQVLQVQNTNDFFCHLCRKLRANEGKVKWRPKSWFRGWWFNTRECLSLRRGHVLNLTFAESCRSGWYR